MQELISAIREINTASNKISVIIKTDETAQALIRTVAGVNKQSLSLLCCTSLLGILTFITEIKISNAVSPVEYPVIRHIFLVIIIILRYFNSF